jgi:hypothetical protein
MSVVIVASSTNDAVADLDFLSLDAVRRLCILPSQGRWRKITIGAGIKNQIFSGKQKQVFDG